MLKTLSIACGRAISPIDALVSANSFAAESVNMADRIGALRPGLEAHIFAPDGDPLNDITAMRRVVFLMKGGVVYRNESRPMPCSSIQVRAVE